MDIAVWSDTEKMPRHRGELIWPRHRLPCAVGRSGIAPDKREGDGATPVGRFPLRRVLYRADRLTLPEIALPVSVIEPSSGWCDDPNDKAYNTQVVLPHKGGHEHLWRLDHLYDVIVVLGHNDAPVRRGLGSAIFLHVAAPDYAATEGCVAVTIDDLIELLVAAKIGDELIVAG
jgi:L,D-peptidoglycan transpeptidase YkuD (ErfK/YbiS/YcfS/YnhG family)